MNDKPVKLSVKAGTGWLFPKTGGYLLLVHQKIGMKSI
jgi:hypothetical protein